MESIPEGLLSVSDKVPAQLGGIDAVDVGDIVQLWKGMFTKVLQYPVLHTQSNLSHLLAAYSINPSVHEGNAGYRLQNFFWRIWSSERLSTSLTGSKLARLFLQISEPTATNTTYSIRPATKVRSIASIFLLNIINWKFRNPSQTRPVRKVIGNTNTQPAIPAAR